MAQIQKNLQADIHILESLLDLSSKIVTDFPGLRVPASLPRTIQSITNPDRLAIVELLQMLFSNACDNNSYTQEPLQSLVPISSKLILCRYTSSGVLLTSLT